MTRLAILMILALAGSAAAEGTVAFFGLAMTGATETDAEAARRARIEEAVRARFAEEGYRLLDLTPVADDLDRVTNPARCYGCETRMAQKLGADYALVGEIQKASEALLGIGLQLRAADTGAPVLGGMVEIRGNTDETWDRGLRSLLNNRIFREDKK